MSTSSSTDEATPAKHLDEETLIHYVRGQLESKVLADWDRHLDVCRECRQLLAEVAKSGALDDADDDSSLPGMVFEDETKAVPPRGASDAGMFAVGELVDHFRIIRTIGRGGMGEVFLARDTQLGRKVALKVILPRYLGSPRIKDRFLFEARATANFNHPHIVSIYGVGEVRGRPYVALEYLEGDSLRVRLETERLSVWSTLRIALAIAEALKEAHSHDILHRDLKPENVILSRDGRLRVVDFGLAQVITRDPDVSRDEHRAGLLTRRPTQVAPLPNDDGGPSGTPAYMAPEQWRGRDETAASDIWALGVVLYEMITGHRPYSGAATPETLKREVLATAPVPTLEDSRLLPTRVPALIYRCLSKDPTERPSAAEVAEELSTLLAVRHAKAESEENPFRGLRPFLDEHAKIFFGREMEIDGLVERLRDESVVTVIGPSGSGKTSFVRAGVVPRLADQGAWTVVSMRPGRDPYRALHRAIEAANAERNASRAGDDATRLLPSGDRLDEPLSVALSRIATRNETRVLLLVDQLEEIYTQVEDRALRERFLGEIQVAADDPLGPVRVLLTLRDDYLDRLAESLRSLGRVVALHELPPDTMVRALEDQADAAALRFEDRKLVERLVRAVSSVRAPLPLLQLTGQQLWERRDRKRSLLLTEAYEAVGGVEGTLVRHAEATIAALDDDKRNIAKAIFLALVDRDGNSRPASRASLVEEPGAAAVLDELIANRLVTVRRADVWIAHERLLDRWPRMTRWIEKAHATRATFIPDDGRRPSQMTAFRIGAVAILAITVFTIAYFSATARFANRDAEEAWAIAHRERARAAMTAGRVLEARASIRKSIETGDTPEARALWWRLDHDPLRWSYRLDAAVLGAALSPDGKGVLTGSSDRTARRFDVETAAVARVATTPDHVVAIAFSPDGRTAALGTWGAGQIFELELATGAKTSRAGHDGGTQVVAYTPDGGHLVSAGNDGAVRIRQPGGEVRHTIQHGASVTSLAVNERHIASGDEAGIVKISDLSTGDLRVTLRPESGAVRALDAHGEILVTAHANGFVGLWRFSDAKLVRMLPAQSGAATAVRFDPDGKLVAVGSSLGALRIYEAASGALHRRFAGHDEAVTNLSFTKDGANLISTSNDGTIKRWALAAGRRGTEAGGHEDSVGAIAFSRSGRYLASAGGDATVRVWDVRTGRTLRVLEGHTSAVRAVTYAPDDRLVASAGNDGSVRLWNAESGRTELVLTGHTERVMSVAFSPNGRWLASASRDGTARVWRVKDGRHIRTVDRHRGPVWSVRFSPDGKAIYSASSDGTVRRSVVVPPKPRRRRAPTDEVWRGHDGPVYGLAVAPNGTVYSGGADKTIRAWDPETGTWTIVGRHAGRVYWLDVDRDGRRLAAPDSTGVVRTWDLTSDKSLRIGQHDDEANSARFSPAGTLVASASDDHTVRLWSPSGTPMWRAPAMFTAPLRLLTHEGLVDVRTHRAQPASDAWHQSLLADVVFAHEAGGRRCSATYDGKVRDGAATVPVAGVTRVAATANGCLAIGDRGLTLVRDTSSKPIVENAIAFAVDDAGVVALRRGEVVVLPPDLSSSKTSAAPEGASAVGRVGATIFLGFDDGTIEALGAGPARRGLDARATLVAAGPAGTIVAGDERGRFAVWPIGSTEPIVTGNLHGAVKHVAIDGHTLAIASDLGSYRTVDLSLLVEPYCDLLRRIWREVPVSRIDGRNVIRAEDPTHTCRKG